jgi:hypothetical protein
MQETPVIYQMIRASTTFRYGALEVYSIFGLAMSVDTYMPEPGGIMAVNSINATSIHHNLQCFLPGQK